MVSWGQATRQCEVEWLRAAASRVVVAAALVAPAVVCKESACTDSQAAPRAAERRAARADLERARPMPKAGGQHLGPAVPRPKAGTAPCNQVGSLDGRLSPMIPAASAAAPGSRPSKPEGR
jgi:hypothetical protein